MKMRKLNCWKLSYGGKTTSEEPLPPTQPSRPGRPPEGLSAGTAAAQPSQDGPRLPLQIGSLIVHVVAVQFISCKKQQAPGEQLCSEAGHSPR